MKTKFLLPVILGALAGLAFWQWELDLSGLTNWIGLHPVLGAAMYLVLVVASVVLLPFSSLPLLPFAVKIYGVVPTALLSAAGWWTGCLIAFQIARLGRRYLERVTSMEAVDRLEEKIPDDVGFGGIVVLRMILPVDVVSFALGLLKRLRLRTYAAASLVGILPFSFVWSYAGGQLGTGQYLSFAFVVAGTVLALLAVRRIWKAHR